jgi:hypothetical protein
MVNLTHNDIRRYQQDILDHVLDILTHDQHVLGIIYTGSYARNEHDGFSDLDLVCYLRDEERTGLQELFEKIATITPTLWYLFIYGVNALYLFENGVRLDLDFCKPSDLDDPSRIYASARIAYDPEGELSKKITLIHSLQSAEHPKWFEPGDPAMIDWFFWMFRQIVCWAKRAQQEDYRSYEKLSNAINSLAEVRIRLVEMRIWVHGTYDYLRRVDLEFARSLSQTYPHFEAADVITCTRRLLGEYEYVCPAYCQKSQAIYPAEKVKIIKKLIEEFEHLE